MKYINYGCGPSAPKEWTNYDVSPTLRIQKTPIIGTLIKSHLNIRFPENVKYGNIIKGLPEKENSCSGAYCSHTLEHLTYVDCIKALKNTYKILKPGGVFRCVLPDLEAYTKQYILDLEKGNVNANSEFMKKSYLGLQNKPLGWKEKLSFSFGNSKHLWMWDHLSLTNLLREVGFIKIRNCKFNDSEDDMFKFVEEEKRFINAVAIEAIK